MGCGVSGIWYLVDPPEAPTQPEGVPENAGLPTTTRRLTRSRQGGSKRAAHACTLRHQGLTPALVSGWGGGGAPLVRGLCWVPGAPWAGLSHRGAVWDCAGALRGPGQGCSMRLRRGCSVELHRGAAWSCSGRSGCARGAAWDCAGAEPGAAQEARHEAALERSMRQCRSAAWGSAGALRGAAQGAAWDCSGA